MQPTLSRLWYSKKHREFAAIDLKKNSLLNKKISILVLLTKYSNTKMLSSRNTIIRSQNSQIILKGLAFHQSQTRSPTLQSLPNYCKFHDTAIFRQDLLETKTVHYQTKSKIITKVGICKIGNYKALCHLKRHLCPVLTYFTLISTT